MFDELKTAEERRSAIKLAIDVKTAARKADLVNRVSHAISEATKSHKFNCDVIVSADLWDNNDQANTELTYMVARLSQKGYKATFQLIHRSATPGGHGGRGHAAQHKITVDWA